MFPQLRTLLLFCFIFCLGATQELQDRIEESKPKSSVPEGWIMVGVSAACFATVFIVYVPSVFYYKYYKKDELDNTNAAGLH